MNARLDQKRRYSRQPHYKASAERDHVFAALFTFVVGAMCGASIALGLMG